MTTTGYLILEGSKYKHHHPDYKNYLKAKGIIEGAAALGADVRANKAELGIDW